MYINDTDRQMEREEKRESREVLREPEKQMQRGIDLFLLYQQIVACKCSYSPDVSSHRCHRFDRAQVCRRGPGYRSQVLANLLLGKMIIFMLKIETTSVYVHNL